MKQAGEKVKYFLNVPFLHVTNGIQKGSSLSVTHMINPPCFWTGMSFSWPWLTQLCIWYSPLNRFKHTKEIQREREKPLSFILIISARMRCVIDCADLSDYCTLRDVQSDKTAVAWALSHRQSSWRYMGDYVFSFSINSGYPSSKSQLSKAQQMAQQ